MATFVEQTKSSIRNRERQMSKRQLVVNLYYYIFGLYKDSLIFAGLTCKACSFEALTTQEDYYWSRRKSTDALNNNNPPNLSPNLRPKSEFKDGHHANRRIPVTAFCINTNSGTILFKTLSSDAVLCGRMSIIFLALQNSPSPWGKVI